MQNQKINLIKNCSFEPVWGELQTRQVFKKPANQDECHDFELFPDIKCDGLRQIINQQKCLQTFQSG